MSTAINTSENELAMIYQKLSEQSQRLDEQSQELNQLRQTLAGLRNGNGHHNGNDASLLDVAESSALTDRRGMLRKVAGLAVGVATVGLLRPSSTSAANGKLISPEGGTGQALIIGDLNSPDNPADRTVLENPGTIIFPLLFLADNFNLNEFVVPANTFIALAAHSDNAGGTPTTGTFYGLYAQATAPAGGDAIGVHAEGDFIGVDAVSDAIGVRATAPGCGVDAICNGFINSFAVQGSSDIGLGGVFRGGRAAISLDTPISPVANPNATPPGGADIGDLYRGTAGSLWYRVNGTNPYRRVADLTTAGALSLQAPQRLVDTRNGSGFAGAGSHLGTNTLQTYNIATLAALPTGARGMVGRITIVNATNSGGLQESPNPPPGPGNDLGFGTAVVNYPPATTIPAFGVPLISALDSSGNIRIHNVMASGSADVIIDITGYFL